MTYDSKKIYNKIKELLNELDNRSDGKSYILITFDKRTQNVSIEVSTSSSPVQNLMLAQITASLKNDCTIVTPIIFPNRTIKIDLNNIVQVQAHVMDYLYVIQQINCKKIAKYWIRAISPKKQTSNPYKNGDKTKPEWWPSSVEHKEPDHLDKKGRVLLLARMALNPEIDLERLQLATLDLTFFSQNQVIMSILDELFFLAASFRNYNSKKVESKRFLELSDLKTAGNSNRLLKLTEITDLLDHESMISNDLFLTVNEMDSDIEKEKGIISNNNELDTIRAMEEFTTGIFSAGDI